MGRNGCPWLTDSVMRQRKRLVGAINLNFAEYARKEMERQNLTVTQLAKKSMLSRQVIDHTLDMKADKRGVYLETAILIACALGMTLDEMTGLEDARREALKKQSRTTGKR